MSPVRAAAPRALERAGAFARRVASAVAALAVLVPAGVAAQEPPPPDTIPVLDSLALADTIPLPDSLAADSLAADTVYFNMPRVEVGPPEGWATGVWAWDHDDILASGAVTLVELLDDVPGMVPLLSGDFGTPLAVSAFGLGGGRIRLLRDGFEVYALEGGVADLARIGLGGITRVRLERHLGEVVVHLESLEHGDHRPYSLIEAGTGELDTNLFRGTFSNPRALGGSVALALERADSRGARGDASGNRTGTWLRYQLHRGDGAGLALDFRRMNTATEAGFATPVSRTDWTVRGRAVLLPGLTGEAYWGRSTHRPEDVQESLATEGGSRTQMGIRTALSRGGIFARADLRRFGAGPETQDVATSGADGDLGLPGSRIDLALGGDRPEIGGFAAELSRASWGDESTSTRRVRAWTRPVLGLSAFASWESGTVGSRMFPLQDVVPAPDTTDAGGTDPDSTATPALEDPRFRITDRSATRLGAMWSWKGVTLSGAVLELEADSLLPLGLEPDRGGPVVAGGARSGWEAFARFPMPLTGLHLEGSLQKWEEGWSYLPEVNYRGAFVFHRTFKASGNLEWWWSVGVRGRDPMTVRILDTEAEPPELDGETGDVEAFVPLAQVPFFQSWYVQMQLRIVSARIFLGWENVSVRDNLQDYPGRLLPGLRAYYGLRWTMWN